MNIDKLSVKFRVSLENKKIGVRRGCKELCLQSEKRTIQISENNQRFHLSFRYQPMKIHNFINR